MTAGQNITQLFTGYQWRTTTISYTFITEYAPYTPQGDQEPGGPTVLSAAQQAATKQLFADIQTFLGVQFVEVPQDNCQNQIGQIAIGMRNNLLVPSWVGQTEASLDLPGKGGDIWLKAGSYGNDAASNEFVSTMLHEIGHALGLSEPTFADSQSKAHYTVMAYDTGGLEAPTKLQLYDISALQYLFMMLRSAAIQATPSTLTLPAIRWNPFGIPAGLTSPRKARR